MSASQRSMSQRSTSQRSTTAQPAGSGQQSPTVPVARRIQPPSWRDTRLLVGIGLVLASVVGGATVIAGAGPAFPAADGLRDLASRLPAATALVLVLPPVYAAARVLTPGTTIGADDVQVVSVRLESSGSRYLSAGAALQPGQVVLRTVAAGELVPRSAVGPRDQVDLRPVSVPIDADAAQPLTPGVLVDVWVADRDADGGSSSYGEPKRLAEGAEVSGTSTNRGTLGSSTGASV